MFFGIQTIALGDNDILLVEAEMQGYRLTTFLSGPTLTLFQFNDSIG
jgi:hypothetical protein